MMITDEAAAQFLLRFSVTDAAHELGPKMTCEEAEAIAGMLRALGAEASARQFIESHAVSDDPHAMHYMGALAGDGDPGYKEFADF